MPSRVRSQAVVSFLCALSTALKGIDRTPQPRGPSDSFRRVEAEIQRFFLKLPEHENLTDEEWSDLEWIRDVLRQLYHDADFVMLDPSKETPH